MSVKVCDSIMGSGKTMAAINYINTQPGPFVYVSPYIDEYQRIKKACAKVDMTTPDKYPSKLVNLIPLLRDKHSIASTHALFASYTPEIAALIRDGHYTLIMDEAFEVIHEMDIGRKDIQYLLDCNVISIDPDTHHVRWLDDRYNGEHFQDLRLRAEAGTLIYYRDTFLFWMFPIEIFKAFDDVIVMTYLFDASNQRYYFDINNVQYSYIGIRGDTPDTYEFCSIEEEPERWSDYKELITIFDNEKFNQIGTPPNAQPNTKSFMSNSMLSHSYLAKAKKHNKRLFTEISKNIRNFFCSYCATLQDDACWSILEEFRQYVQPKGYLRCWKACTMRATNDLRHIHYAAYIRNIYMNPFLRQYYQENGCQVDEDRYALAELVQWVWRFSVRDKQPMVLYLPSSRMRYLFTKWLDDVSNGVEVRKRNPTERITETVNEQSA